MKIWELKRTIEDMKLPDDAEIMVQDAVGMRFGTILSYARKDEKILTIVADDIIF